MKVIILAGGRGTRLPNSAKDIPKALVPIDGRKTMLDHQLELLAAHGLTDVRLSLCFRADQIIQHLRDADKNHIEYCVETEPLGTGGAVRFAADDLNDDFMVLNGDTISNFNFSEILRHHTPGMPLIVSAWREDARDFGLLEIQNGKITAFLEKPTELKSGYINAGCYILHPVHLEHIKEKTFMLEKEVFPHLAATGNLRAFVHKGFWQDAGTEERLASVRNFES